jgi:hypothetical protein
MNYGPAGSSSNTFLQISRAAQAYLEVRKAELIAEAKAISGQSAVVLLASQAANCPNTTPNANAINGLCGTVTSP